MSLSGRGKEQRDFRRMSIDASATIIYARGDEMRRIKGVCKDLSATGLSLQVEEALQVGDVIEVVIEGTQVQALDVKARVLRVEDLGQGAFLLGCEATSIR